MQSEILELLRQTKSFEEINSLLPTTEMDELNFCNLIFYLQFKFPEVKTLLENNYSLLYLLSNSILKKEGSARYFEKKIVLPIIYNQLYSYLEFLFESLDLNTKKIIYKGCGSSNFTFFTNDKVLKLGDKRKTFDFPTFYRINDLIVQKDFSRKNAENKHLYFEVSKRGMEVTLTDVDISAIKEDFERAGLVLTDPNYQQNFALFDEEQTPDHFYDVDGIHPKIHLEESMQYQKKKIKLIDLDYIYRKEASDKVYAPKM